MRFPTDSSHIDAIVTEGAWSRGGEFLPCDAPDPSVIEQVFRREVLARLHWAERLSDAFLESLLSWTHSGFSVYAQQAIEPADGTKLERLARYATRPPIRLDAVERTEEGLVKIATPPDPRTGASEIVLDPLDWVRAMTLQIPDRRRHPVRYYGAYACRTRGARRRRSASGAPRTDTTKFDDRDFDPAKADERGDSVLGADRAVAPARRSDDERREAPVPKAPASSMRPRAPHRRLSDGQPAAPARRCHRASRIESPIRLTARPAPGPPCGSSQARSPTLPAPYSRRATSTGQ